MSRGAIRISKLIPGASRRGPAATMALTAAILAIGLIPTAGNSPIQGILRSVHAVEANRDDHEKQATGYYVGLIDGDTSSSRDELSLALLGKPREWVSFHKVGVARYLQGDFLQFELRRNVDTPIFNSRFTTNAQGLRDRPYSLEKPEGIYRVALLGSSMDMGWGVSTEETYENQFEDWLNAHAEKWGLARRFEVLNFAMAAYSPLHRLEAFERKVRDYQPDLVLYAATRLDTRLLQIHLVGLLQDRIDLKYDFARHALNIAGIREADLALNDSGQLIAKDRIKSRLTPILWQVHEDAISRLATDCRSEGAALAMLIIPRASESDRPEYRGPDISRFQAIARRLGLPLADLSASFDEQEPAAIEIAPWDDHPNALGHRLLFLSLGRKVVEDPALYQLFFDADPSILGPLPEE